MNKYERCVYNKKYYVENKDKIIEQNKLYVINNKDKVANRKRKYDLAHVEQKVISHSKNRGVGTFILMPDIFPPEENIEVDYHHQFDIIVPIPTKIHTSGHSSKKGLSHYVHCGDWIEKLYGLSVENLLDECLNNGDEE